MEQIKSWNHPDNAPQSKEIIYLSESGYVSKCKWVDREERGEGFWDEDITDWVINMQGWLPMPDKLSQED